jgi:integrase
MPVWQEKGRGWRYRFQFRGEFYQAGGFKTKSEARAAEAEKRKEVKRPPTPIGTGYDFRTAANEYLDYCQRRFVVKTYEKKVFCYKSFQAYTGNLPLAEISARTVISYLSQRPSNSNYNEHRKNLCALFQWCFKHGLIPQNPCLFVDAMPAAAKRKQIPSQEEMLKILLASGDYRPFFLALYSLAARLGEINNLRWEDVNFEKRTVTLWTRKTRDGSMRPQVKAMNAELYNEFSRLYNKRSGEWVFPNPETGLPYKNRRAQIKRACINAGVPYYGWHSIRHHVASLLSDNHKVSLPTIQKMLGHQRLTTTERYIQSLSEGVREAADLLKIETLPEKLPAEEEGEG